LDGRFIKIFRDTVTQPSSIKKFKGEGMPNHEYSSEKGDLYVEFKVNFPTQFTEVQLKLWEQFFK
jgi:DnaJ-class molecular chaperone